MKKIKITLILFFINSVVAFGQSQNVKSIFPSDKLPGFKNIVDRVNKPLSSFCNVVFIRHGHRGAENALSEKGIKQSIIVANYISKALSLGGDFEKGFDYYGRSISKRVQITMSPVEDFFKQEGIDLSNVIFEGFKEISGDIPSTSYDNKISTLAISKIHHECNKNLIKGRAVNLLIGSHGAIIKRIFEQLTKKRWGGFRGNGYTHHAEPYILTLNSKIRLKETPIKGRNSNGDIVPANENYESLVTSTPVFSLYNPGGDKETRKNREHSLHVEPYITSSNNGVTAKDQNYLNYINQLLIK